MTHRIHNFNAGPAALPLSVLEEVQRELVDFRGSGMSILEVSHRSKWFEDVLDDAIVRIKRLLKLGDHFQVLFLQGGASLQFAMVPMNLAIPGKPVSYADTGTWATNAIKQARIQKLDVRVVASSEDREYTYIPKNVVAAPDSSYFHFTSNNTIRGTQWRAFPDGGGVPLISDMSSDFLSREFDPEPFGLFYAGAQKNAGPSGVTVVAIREDMLKRCPDDLPTMLKYTIHSDKKSMYNTPPCFSIYVVQLVAKWIEETVGGLAKMEALNKRKAEYLYSYMDSQDFYNGTTEADSRSWMNVTFRLANKDLEPKFISEATAAGLGGLKGHRSVGGCRASIYNATSFEAVKALVDFMKEFVQKNG
ncbi:MAG: 3-phosphoserine/phosphohydroxythreonine transaminase [Syntrophobacteraceae bacterium]